MRSSTTPARPTLAVAALAAALLGTAGPTAAQSADAVVAFTGVNVIPMDREGVVENQTVVVRGDRIVEVGPASAVRVPAGARRVDGKGKYLIPGLAEMHGHIPGGQAPDSLVERTLYLYVAHGVTRVRGMLGHPRHLELRARAGRGEIVSPSIRTSGPSINGQSVSTPDSAVRTAVSQQRAGYDLIKIHPGVKREVFDSLAASAGRVGIRFAGHVPLDVGVHRALEARYWSIDHLDGYVEALAEPGGPESQFFGLNLVGRIDESKIPALVAATVKAGTWNVPTQILMENLAGGTPSATLAARPEMRFVSDQALAQWRQVTDGMLEQVGTTREDARRWLEVRRRLIKALHDGGAGLLLGSDAPQVWNVPGYSTHRELEALVAAGLTPWQALATGTVNVDRFYGDERAGTITPGSRADLILLDANPLADIRNTLKQAGVMVRGRWMERAEVERGLARYAVR